MENTLEQWKDFAMEKMDNISDTLQDFDVEQLYQFLEAEKAFELINLAALFPWTLILFLPTLSFSKFIARLYILAVASFYSFILLTALFEQYPLISEMDPSSVLSFSFLMEILSKESIVIGTWAHLKAFDLCVAMYITDDARAAGIPYFLVFPILLISFVFGPLGYAIYQLVRIPSLLASCCSKETNKYKLD